MNESPREVVDAKRPETSRKRTGGRQKEISRRKGASQK
jgi:hypothetical protein